MQHFLKLIKRQSTVVCVVPVPLQLVLAVVVVAVMTLCALSALCLTRRVNKALLESPQQLNTLKCQSTHTHTRTRPHTPKTHTHSRAYMLACFKSRLSINNLWNLLNWPRGAHCRCSLALQKPLSRWQTREERKTTKTITAAAWFSSAMKIFGFPFRGLRWTALDAH